MLEQVKQPGKEASSGPDALPAAESGLSREAYALLAQANLLRVRGQWPEAVEACRAALRLAPDSAAAQSLLGDIYENQGELDDAAQWYRMALDSSPDSAADRLKLNRLITRKDAPEAALPVSISPRPAYPTPERALRYFALAAALMILVVIGLAFAAVHRHAALDSLGLGTDSEVKAQPVVVAPAAGLAPPLRDSAEQSLLNTLNASPAFSAQSLTALEVQIDPRTGQCSLTVGLTSASAPLRADIERAALSAALAAASAAGSASSFTIRCILPAAGSGGTASGGTLVFVGDVARAALPPVPVGGGDPVAALSDAEIVPLFANVWWALAVPT